MSRYQTIILGLGAMGSAALYQLSKRGNKVLGIDRFSPPHVFGSTHGETRITRQALGEGAVYTPLSLRSYEIWKELEEKTGQDLLTITGGLIVGDPGTTRSLHGSANFLRQTIASAKAYGIAHDRLSSREIRRRFPQFRVSDTDEGYYEYDAGFLRPQNCVAAQLSLSQAQGAEVHTHEKVMEFFPQADGVRVRTDRGAYTADTLIVSAGPWIGEFVGEEYRDLLKVQRQVMYWFAVDDPIPFDPARCPIFIWQFSSGGGDWVYGFPLADGPGGGIKVASEDFAAAITPEQTDRTVHEEEKRVMYARRIAPYISGVTGDCLRAVVCLYTVTPDSHFILDTLPGHPQVILASPCSGHGFKHSAAIGEALAEMALDRQTHLDISAFSLSRFSTPAS